LNNNVFGGSTIESDGSPTKEVSFVVYLNIMNENIHHNTIVKVHNEGVCGYYSKHEFLHLVFRILKYCYGSVEIP